MINKNISHFTDKKYTAGSRKNSRVHDVSTPNELLGSMPQLNKQLYLYEIKIEPDFNAANFDDNQRDNIQIFQNLMRSNRSYAILTSNLIPRLGLMKFFFSFGRVNCSISYEPVHIKINKQHELDALKRFHCVLFEDVLGIMRTFFVYDHVNSIIIVPTKNREIDWNTVSEFQKWSPFQEKTPAERQNATYNEEDWLYKVITPWYRADSDIRYVVTRLSTHETPFSQFPNPAYEDYASYALDKYPNVVQVFNKNQFMIEVKAMTRNLNLLHAGEGEDGSKKKTIRGQELLIPELCHNFGYSGDLWLKALILPSILHRLTYLLHAENLRVSINRFVGLHIANYIPDALLYSMPTKKKANDKAIIQNPITFPRPGEKPPIELSMYDIVPLRQTIKVSAQESDEPTDLERNFINVYPVDIDYYYQYVNRKLNDMSINDGPSQNMRLNRYQQKPPALCDVPPENKLHIKILDIELSTQINRGLEQHELLAALTTAQSSDVFHMELLEVLGDAFLKFGVSLYLTQKHGNWHEGHLTEMKGQIVGNRNLCYNGIRMGLPGKIKVHRFNPKTDWQPPMFTVDEAVKVISIVIL